LKIEKNPEACEDIPDRMIQAFRLFNGLTVSCCMTVFCVLKISQTTNGHSRSICLVSFTAPCYSNGAVLPSYDVCPSVCPWRWWAL